MNDREIPTALGLLAVFASVAVIAAAIGLTLVVLTALGGGR